MRSDRSAGSKPDPGVQGAQSVDRAVEVLRIVGDHDRQGAKASDIARLAALTAPTAHRILRALEGHGLIERHGGTGRFHLGPEIRVLGAIVGERYGIEQAASPSLHALAEETGDSALLTVRRRSQSFCMARVEGTFPIRSQVLAPGDSHPLGISSGGMAILASLSDDDVEQVLRECAGDIRDRFPRYSVELLREQVAETRKAGFAVNPGLIIEQSVGIAVAVASPAGECFGALTVAGIDFRMAEPRRTEIVRLLQQEAARVYAWLTNPSSTIDPSAPAGRQRR